MPSISSASDDSLRALETSEGPDYALRPPGRPGRSNTVSTFSGFEFRPDLMPLTLSEVEQDGEPAIEKTVGLVNGKGILLLSRAPLTNGLHLYVGIALLVGIQVGSGILYATANYRRILSPDVNSLQLVAGCGSC